MCPAVFYFFDMCFGGFDRLAEYLLLLYHNLLLYNSYYAFRSSTTYPKLLVWFACGVFFYPLNLLAAPELEVTCPLTKDPAAEIKVDETVHFRSTDPNHTELVGYVFKPVAAEPNQTFPAIVMLHGRTGPYSHSKKVRDKEDPQADDLSKRHKCWGRYWAEQGYLALLVDSFKPRGYHKGFDKGSHCCRPEAVNERTVRPHDAYSARNYLRGRNDVNKDRIGIQGWSNGGSTVMNTLSKVNVGLKDPDAKNGFQAGLAFYPGCAIKTDWTSKHKCPCNPAEKVNCSALHMEKNWESYAPLRLFLATNDDEVNPDFCRARLHEVEVTKCTKQESVRCFDEKHAEHNFDDPDNWKRQLSTPDIIECKSTVEGSPEKANCDATLDARAKATAFFEQHLKK
jgi:dienelactone hydrolase